MEGKSRRTAPWMARFDGFVKQSEPKKHNSYSILTASVSACKVYFTAAGASGVSNNLKIKKHRINAMLSGWAVFN